jgi:antitoxin (DNA-binding transcriptional repressor) of toxin-antitoxin stability system
MDATERQMDVTEFRTHLLRCADQIIRTGETIVVTRRGQPIFRVEPAAPAPRSLAGSVRVLVSREDFMAPFNDEWNADT